MEGASYSVTNAYNYGEEIRESGCHSSAALKSKWDRDSTTGIKLHIKYQEKNMQGEEKLV